MIDLMENKVLGPMIQREIDKGLQGARQEARQEGRQEGRLEGRREGAVELLQRILAQRFGPLPEWAISKLHQGSPAELENWTLRLLDYGDLAAILG